MGMLDADALARLIDASDRNYRAIANNIANVNTPGFKAARVEFARALDEALDARGRLRPGANIETRLVHPDFPADGADGNNVRLEREIVDMNKTAIRMKTLLAVLHERIRRFRAAIDGR